MAAVTCVSTDDVSAHLLTRPGTEVVKTGQITSWPAGWTDKESITRAAWDEWNAERLQGLANLDGGKRARTYYKAHKEELTDGMAVSWNERYHVGDDIRPGDPDALFAAMWDFYDLGEMAFMAERQNEPIKEGVTVYSLTPPAIIKREDKDRLPGVIPEWAKLIVAATDVNPSYALSTVVLAFGDNQRAAVVWYGLHRISIPDAWTDGEKQVAISKELEIHGKQIAALPTPPNNWIIDGRGSPQDTVINFCANSVRICTVPAITAFGSGSRQYRAVGKKNQRIIMHEQCHVNRETSVRRWIVFNSDYWLEQAQKSWTGTLGAPGSCDLPKGRHDDFATQICNEQIVAKGELNGRMVYEVSTGRGPHDFGDCMKMGFVMAAVEGIGTGGGQVVKKAERKKYSQADLRR